MQCAPSACLFCVYTRNKLRTLLVEVTSSTTQLLGYLFFSVFKVKTNIGAVAGNENVEKFPGVIVYRFLLNRVAFLEMISTIMMHVVLTYRTCSKFEF